MRTGRSLHSNFRSLITSGSVAVPLRILDKKMDRVAASDGV